MFIQARASRRFITMIFLGIFAVTFTVMADYAYTMQQGRRAGDDPLISLPQEKESDKSSRVKRNRGKGSDKASRVSSKRSKGNGKASRVSSKRGKGNGKASRVSSKRGKGNGKASRVSSKRGKGNGKASRVSSKRSKGNGKASHVTRQQGKGRDTAPRHTWQRGKGSGKTPRVTWQRGTGSGKSHLFRDPIKRRVISPRFVRYGHVVPRLPFGYRRVWHRSKPYYYYRGTFYRPYRSGFTVIGPPIGTVVVSLPIGYQRVWLGNEAYYAYGGVLYRRAPSGYAVVESPPEIVVEKEPPAVVQPSGISSGKVSVTSSVLNVRTGPDLNYPVIYQVHEGYILEIHGSDTEWLYVQLPNGEYGWVMNVYTLPLEPGSG